ncbi:nucleoside 5-triphosphatase RdgB (dHAPTP, dITP,XTP-specific) [Helicobacter heilmannii]|uniref:nucleoside 5-triphosphatase RdgB (dHAPTP, dITP,XTP-specific) n=1 Tax=Helicobacter heilmannii TaxID=35817 RepID=UPI0006A01A0B|nr:nucleoside 5-triphosphatase RdgB (dHAPTP, dITP,XTP-specific) [Helicobacter heilmannii]CRF46597.1 Nucleoside 5-triphosphatase RdgB (dHAPTP, dITP, XTP-specific) [Helicobacter heilmannii]
MQPILLDIYNASGQFMGVKSFRAWDNVDNINTWLRGFVDKKGETLAHIVMIPPDMQYNNQVAILSKPQARYCYTITQANLIPLSVYFSVRHCIKATWINDRDQFYAPLDDSWQGDTTFLGDCLVFMLFHGQNRISTAYGPNHFIPFKEKEVSPKGRYAYHTLLDFLEGKSLASRTAKAKKELFSQSTPATIQARPSFSPVALSVLHAGQELYTYYHTQEKSDPNASLYDIKEFFSGRDAKGKLKPASKAKDAHYKMLYAQLKEALEALAQALQPKVYAYGFLR